MELNVLGQINAESLAHMRSRSSCVKLAKNGYVHLLGTDTHRVERNDAPLSVGREILAKKLGDDFVAEIDRNGEQILSDCPIEVFIR
jgi:protein-tyrosine phosphatase